MATTREKLFIGGTLDGQERRIPDCPIYEYAPIGQHVERYEQDDEGRMVFVGRVLSRGTAWLDAQSAREQRKRALRDATWRRYEERKRARKGGEAA